MTLNNDDRKMIELCIENAVMKAMEQHCRQAKDMMEKAIDGHVKTCPVSMSLKMKMQFVAGMAFAFSLIGGSVSIVGAKILGVLK